jgi:hypothetical protein
MTSTELLRVRLPFSCFLPAVPWIAGATFTLLFVAILIKSSSFVDALKVGAIVACVVGAFLVPLLIVCALTYPVTVRNSGISSYNPYGSWQEESMRWTDIAEVRQTRVIGVRYIRVESINGAGLWIPTRALESRDLAVAVLQSSPQDGPLARFISHAV